MESTSDGNPPRRSYSYLRQRSGSSADARRQLLSKDSADFSDISNAPTYVSASPPIHQSAGFTGSRTAYERIGEEEEYPEHMDAPGTVHRDPVSGGSSGQTVQARRSSSIQSLSRAPPGRRRQSGQAKPALHKSFSQDTMNSTIRSPPDTIPEHEMDDFGFKTDIGGTQYPYQSMYETDFGGDNNIKSTFAAADTSFHPYINVEDTDGLNFNSLNRAASMTQPSIRSAYDTGFDPTLNCQSQHKFYQGRSNWIAITILILSIYSTIFSGIYAVIAFWAPRYGTMIQAKGSLSISTASLLTALFGKTIELSFVTVFVAFLGQVLSRRAFMRGQGRGVTLSEFSLRTWVMQPGSLITHWEPLRYTGWTVLGVSSLIATVIAMLYTTASDALVQPQLMFGSWSNLTMTGMIHSSYANAAYLEDICKTPISKYVDPEYAGSTCLQIQHSAQAFHNYQRYLADWTRVITLNGTSTTDLNTRPQGFALLGEDTTVQAPWVDIVDVAETSQKWGRIVNNVSMSVPHAGVVAAAKDPQNKILQPQELDGLGLYNIKATVPNPVIHVLCANMAEEELQPIVYEAFPNADPVKVGTWPAQIDDIQDYSSGLNSSSLNSTVVDDLFHWGKKYGVGHWPPIFARYPDDFNTLLNQTTGQYGRTAIYLLAKADRFASSDANRYSLCQIQSSITPMCSTHYNASDTGGSLRASCPSPPDDLSYISAEPDAPSGEDTLNADWLYVAAEWGNSLSLNAGINEEADASNARLLSQLILQEPSLNASLPSIAEALAVLAGCTALESSRDTPFVPFWNYTVPPKFSNILPNPKPEHFVAQVRAQEYASGGVYQWQRAFYPVIFLLFLTNLGCLIYFLSHSGLVTDFTEPPNLFSLAVNSPPSQSMAGSCGAGPHGEQYKVGWVVMQEGDHLFVVGGDDAGAPKPQTMNKSFSNLRQRVHGRVSPLLPERFRARDDKTLPSVQWAELRSPPSGPSTGGITPGSGGSNGLTTSRTWGQNSLRSEPSMSSLNAAVSPYGSSPGSADARSPLSRMYSVLSKRTSVL